MLRAMIDRIVELSVPIIQEVHGVDYCDKSITPVRLPMPTALMVSTLEGLAGYIKSDFDKPGGLLLHIVGEARVNLYGPLVETTKQRECYMLCAYDEPGFNFGCAYDEPGFSFGMVHDPETFIIALQSLFIRDENVELLLRVASNLTDVATANYKDDGVSQDVEVKTGVVKIEEITIPNPIELQPRRTFTAVEQPKSQFVFRISRRGENVPLGCALHEADGGAWKVEAARRIRQWLEQALVAEGVVIIM